MLTKKQVADARKRALRMLAEAGIAVTPAEAATVEVADFGLNDLRHTGLEIITYVNNDRYCAKELILFPGQTCPEHRHPTVAGRPGKRETFRCRRGRVWLYVEGRRSARIHAKVPPGCGKWYTAFREIELKPGCQYTLEPNTLHWFQAGRNGAVVSEFSSTSRDESDVFTDPRIRRLPEVEG
jgi:D-lyxose ketol-isomerase